MHELAKRIYKACHITGDFTLRSGLKSNDYFDKYLFESDPYLLENIVMIMSLKMPKMPLYYDAFAGLEMGGIPIAVHLSYLFSIPAVFVRKKAKEYGTKKIIEGISVKDKHVIIVEDVVSIGGQIILSAESLRKEGAIVDNVVCVIDREMGATEKLKAEGLTLKPLFTISELKKGGNNV